MKGRVTVNFVAGRYAVFQKKHKILIFGCNLGIIEHIKVKFDMSGHLNV